LKNRVTPCQFGGNPDCSQCGCIASAGLFAVGEYRLFNILPLRKIFEVSERIGKRFGKSREVKTGSYQEVTETDEKVTKLIKLLSRFRQF
jgi:hypothetical protein